MVHVEQHVPEAPQNNEMKLTRSALFRAVRPLHTDLSVLRTHRPPRGASVSRYRSSAFVLALFCSMSLAPAAPSQPAASRCDSAAVSLYGRSAVRPTSEPGALITEPKKLRQASPVFPKQWPKRCRGTMTIHEVLIAPSGRVERVFSTRTPCPEFDSAVSAALRQWQYSPLIVDKTAVPVCITVTTLVHPR